MTTLSPTASAQAAQAFEANMLGAMLKPMFDTVNSADGLFGGGAGESTWRPMLVEAIAKQMAAHGGVGLQAAVLRQMQQMQEGAHQ